jgi:hypothetical protein
MEINRHVFAKKETLMRNTEHAEIKIDKHNLYLNAFIDRHCVINNIY